MRRRPSLFYADWAHEIPAGYGRLRAYRARLLSHPSIVRVVEEARPFRHYSRWVRRRVTERDGLCRAEYCRRG